MVSSEKRPIDRIEEANGVLAEAAELTEHIRDTDPAWCRERLLTQVIEMIDDAHEETLEAHLEMEDATNV